MALPLAAIPFAVSALQAVGGGIQAGAGAKKRRNIIRPDYAIPEEVLKNVKQAETEATYGLDAASKQLATQGIDRSTASALYGAGTRRAGLAGMSGVVQSGADAFANLAAMDAQEMARKKGIAMGARSEMAGYKDKAFEYNKMEPYRMEVDETQALIGAGLQNIMGGLQTAASTGMYAMGSGTGSSSTPVTGGGEVKSTMTPEQNFMTEAQKKQAWYANLTPEQKKALSLAGKNIMIK